MPYPVLKYLSTQYAHYCYCYRGSRGSRLKLPHLGQRGHHAQRTHRISQATDACREWSRPKSRRRRSVALERAAEPATFCGGGGSSRVGHLKTSGCVGEFAVTDVISVILKSFATTIIHTTGSIVIGIVHVDYSHS